MVLSATAYDQDDHRTQTTRPQDDHRTTQRGGRKGQMPGPIHHSEFSGHAAMPLATRPVGSDPVRVPAQPARPHVSRWRSKRRRRRPGDDSSPAAGTATAGKHGGRQATATGRRQATGTAGDRHSRQAAGTRATGGWPYWWRSWTWFVMGIMAGRAKLRSIRKTAHVGFSRARITARRLVTANHRPLPGSVPDWNDLGTNSQILGIPYC